MQEFLTSPSFVSKCRLVYNKKTIAETRHYRTDSLIFDTNDLKTTHKWRMYFFLAKVSHSDHPFTKKRDWRIWYGNVLSLNY